MAFDALLALEFVSRGPYTWHVTSLSPCTRRTEPSALDVDGDDEDDDAEACGSKWISSERNSYGLRPSMRSSDGFRSSVRDIVVGGEADRGV